MAAKRARRDPNSWTEVELPKGSLSDALLDLAHPFIEAHSASTERRSVMEKTIAFWNAHVLASKYWGHPELKELKALKKLMRGRQASREDATLFDQLSERWRAHQLDPRLVATWTYEPDASGALRLDCTVSLPEGVRAKIPPPIERRIAIGGRFLDEVSISTSRTTGLRFPIERHRAEIGSDGKVTIYAMMPSVLQLFAEGRLMRIGAAPVDIEISGKKLGPMVLVAVRSGGLSGGNDLAVLVFDSPRPTS